MIIREGTVVEEGTLDELRHLTRSTITIETEAENSHLAQLNGVHDFVQKVTSLNLLLITKLSM